MMQKAINDLFEQNLGFNPADPTIMHIDLNSCFATIEQQANRFLRNKPIAVAARESEYSCVLAPSIEAKIFGVKVGMRVKDAKLLCPNLITLSPDPPKYRVAHSRLRKILNSYTDEVLPRSIDEFVLDLKGTPSFSIGIREVALDIKKRIKKDLGEWVRVSIGISTNGFLAKTASGLHKPDGLDFITKDNYLQVFSELELRDLCGIGYKSEQRLIKAGIKNVSDLYHSSGLNNKTIFHAITGFYWYFRLRGWSVEDSNHSRKSFSNSYVIPKGFDSSDRVIPIMMKLIEKMCFRMRKYGFGTRGVGISLLYRNKTHWSLRKVLREALFSTADIYKEIKALFDKSPQNQSVKLVAVFVFDLLTEEVGQPDLFSEKEKKANLTQALDFINSRWGDFVVYPALMLGTRDKVPDSIGFGRV